ncbi:MAG: DJ-1/PfpI family protein [Muribaculaceae bacterium]|nr:DJ-1/PfpI family protein [Muribaculaceae bacterium]
MKSNYVFLADGFEEIEALTVVDVMRRAGMRVRTVSIAQDLEVVGAHHVRVLADEHISDVEFDDEVDWLVLPGGMPGAVNLLNCEPLCHALLAHYNCGGNVAAICASPSIVFGPLGILEGRKATCYPGMEQGMKGADCVEQMAVVDGNVITGRGPAAAAEFALAIVEASCGTDTANQVAQGMLLA